MARRVNYFFSEEELAFNDSLDAWEFLLRMGFQEHQLVREGNTIRLFCPLHKDHIRRSLIIYADKNQYRCQYQNCVGHKGGNLLEFYSAYTGVDVADAMQHIMSAASGGADSLIEQADKLIQEGSLVEALPILQKAVQADPDNEISRCRLAALYLELGDRDSGYNEYMKAAEHFGIRGDLDKMLNIYNILVIITPDDVAVRKQLATLYSRLKRAEDAVAQLKWVVDRHIRRGELGDAADICRRMINMCPDYPESHRILGEIFLKQGDYFQAADELQSAIVHYIRENNLTRAKQTVELGLRYMPGNLALKDMRTKIDQAIEFKKSLGEQHADEREREFEAWLADLKTSVGLMPGTGAAPAKGPTPPKPKPAKAVPAEEAPAPAPPAPAPPPSGPPSPADLPAAKRKPAAEEAVGELPEMAAMPKLDPNDPRIALCLNNLRDRTPEEIESLYQHLVSMFRDVQQSAKDGTISEFEAGVLLEFYAAFCLAFDSYRASTAPEQR
ncbi:MAG: tetratricopeptide repeat protein [Candidatus Sumerlaeaceae bacterium]|nr:tetratricopeptide repeat protein [Candidatus Sumerlaeaceae bacterium]